MLRVWTVKVGRAAALIVLTCMYLCTPAAYAQVDPPPSADAIANEEIAPVPEDASDGQTDGREASDLADAVFIERVNDVLDRGPAEGDSSDQVVPSPTSRMLQAIFALCFVLALILFVYYGVRRWGKKVPLLAGASLGSVLGRIHLERGTTLHFVRTGGRVLIVGVNGNAVSLVSDFDAAAFESFEPGREEENEAAPPFNPDSFLAQLQASSRAVGPGLEMEQAPVDDDEIAALRGDIQRLQRYLREESRESQD